MKADVTAASCNVVQYLNTLMTVDENAKYIEDGYGGRVVMEIRTLSDLYNLVCKITEMCKGSKWETDSVVVKASKMLDNGKTVVLDTPALDIEIYDYYME